MERVAGMMKRDLYAMSGREYDLLIIGGGITGACIARDAALRGLSVALLDKNDFAGATTAASSKLIHGGLRYLQNLELGLVRESLRERRIWSNIAPHMIDPLTFLMPTTDARIRGRLKMYLGLTAYDWLAYDRNRLDDPEKAIPSHQFMPREEVVALEPGLEPFEMTGAMIFYDYQMYSPERLALECIMSAAEAGADAANYAEVTGFLREENMITGVAVRDRRRHGGGELAISARMTVNAAGPWADILMSVISGESSQRTLLRSKGIHILTRPLSRGHGIAVTTGKSHFFILPWRGHSIIGTTDTPWEGNPDDFCVTEKDIRDFLDIINHGYPSAELSMDDVLHFYGGLRPIVDQTTDRLEPVEEENGEVDTYNASRASEVYDHESEEDLKGIITSIGGKWTTSRNLAEQVVDLAMSKLGMEPAASHSAFTPTWGGYVGPFNDFLRRCHVKFSALPGEVIENLAKNYGSHIDDVLELTEDNPDLAKRVCDRHPDIGAQIIFALRNEMAYNLDDVFFRRTGLGTLGSPGEETIARVAGIMQRELDWTDAEKDRQTAKTASFFQPAAETAREEAGADA
jgi:glycerol-3-phosphate dehydrogenase